VSSRRDVEDEDAIGIHPWSHQKRTICDRIPREPGPQPISPSRKPVDAIKWRSTCPPHPFLTSTSTARPATPSTFTLTRSTAPPVIRTYSDFGMPAHAPDAQNVVYGQVFSNSGFTVMAYDVPGTSDDAPALSGSARRLNGTTITDQTFFLALSGD